MVIDIINIIIFYTFLVFGFCYKPKYFLMWIIYVLCFFIQQDIHQKLILMIISIIVGMDIKDYVNGINLTKYVKLKGKQFKDYLEFTKNDWYNALYDKVNYKHSVYKDCLLKYKSLVDDVDRDLSKNKLKKDFIDSENEIIKLESKKLGFIEMFANEVSLHLLNIKFNTAYVYDMDSSKLIDKNSKKIIEDDGVNGIFNYYKSSILNTVVLKWNKKTSFAVSASLYKENDVLKGKTEKNYINIIPIDNSATEKFIIEDNFKKWVESYNINCYDFE